MSNNITINLKNCGCCGGEASPNGSQDVPFNDLGDPANPSGPPEGYSDPGTSIEDRQCKMAVWLYSWVEWSVDSLANSTTGNTLLGVLKASAVLPLGTIILPIVIGIVTTGISAILTGPDPTEAVIFYMSWGITSAILISLAAIPTVNITVPLLQDALPIIQGKKDDIICSMSTAQSAQQARINLERSLADTDLSISQKALVLAFLPNFFFTMLFFKPDWWPSFDTDELTPITDTCCGGFIDGDPVTPASVEHCQSSYFIVDKLAQTFYAVHEQFGLWVGDLNPFNDDRGIIFDNVQESLVIPPKVKELAADYRGFEWSVTEVIYAATYSLIPNGGLAVDPGYDDLADYITNNRAALVTLLQAEANVTDAYDAIKADLDAWIDANITNANVAADVKTSLDALISPVNDPPSLMGLLFSQDSDVSGYALADCQVAGAGHYLTAIDMITPFGTYVSHEDEAELLGVEDDLFLQIGSAEQQISHYVDADFGQVYNDAIQLDLRLKSPNTASSGRRYYWISFSVKEAVNDPWVGVGTAYVNQTDLDDLDWHWRSVAFSARNVRYVRMTLSRGTNAFGWWGYMHLDALKVCVEAP